MPAGLEKSVRVQKCVSIVHVHVRVHVHVHVHSSIRTREHNKTAERQK